MSQDRANAENPVESLSIDEARAELRRLGAERDRLQAEKDARRREFMQLRTGPCALCEQPIPLWLFSKRKRAWQRASKTLNAASDAERKYRKAYLARSSPADASAVEGSSPMAPLRVLRMPTPHGWEDPRHLLGELLRAFGWRAENMPPPGPVPPRARAGQPTDPAERERLYREELEEAEPLLRELVQRAEALRGGPLRRPPDYEREWRSIVETWNEAIRTRRWFQMTPLCAVCGKALFRRAPWYDRKKPKVPELSFNCSRECKNTKSQREHRLRKKLSPHSSDE